MTTFHLTGRLTPDRQLLVEIPDNVPTGLVQVTIEFTEPVPIGNEGAAREQARALLSAAGLLSTAWKAPPDFVPPSHDIPLIRLAPGASLDEMQYEDRREDD